MISDKAVRCPKCGCPTKTETVQHQDNAPSNVAPVYDEEESHSNKWLYVVIAVLLATIVGGGYWWYSHSKEDQEVRLFAEELSSAITTGDTTILTRIFPNAAKADSLALKYTTDSLQAETHGDTLVIRFSQDVSLVALKDANGKFRVVGSHGLFAYPDSILKLAKSTGWYDVNLDDTLNAVRMTDNYFMDWLKDKISNDTKNNLKIVKSVFSAKSKIGSHAKTYQCNVTIKNEGDRDITENEYNIIVRETGNDCCYPSEGYDGIIMTPYIKILKTLTGKAIPAKETVSFSWVDDEKERSTGDYDDDGYYFGKSYYWKDRKSLQCTITSQLNAGKLFASYHPTGKEYTEYLASKK